MPIVLRLKGYRFWFYEADLSEPPHVHIGKDGKEAKFWMNPIRVAREGKFKAVELREIERLLDQHQAFILEVWQNEQQKRSHG